MSEYLFKATNGNRATHGGDYLYRHDMELSGLSWWRSSLSAMSTSALITDWWDDVDRFFYGPGLSEGRYAVVRLEADDG